ncbi:hypothetical protein HO173_003700 [Letharia columbiana]|uniref:Uncharacterized protein n=1 Tax=Letharia columbiana TaxID=112416 RepID=A0A8H6G0C4_9LECA|nr:uncharacterized protein HO173_003700 [Letharia columbiana]KAF6238066.1 hypothetical protein HO173_003700 [Letharia columbiana]
MTTVQASSLANTSTGPPAPAQTQEQSTSLPTAVGVGIGVPLGTTAIGFLGFWFWKEAVRQRRSKARIPTQRTGLNNSSRFAAAPIDRSLKELPDTHLPRELDGQGGIVLPGI